MPTSAPDAAAQGRRKSSAQLAALEKANKDTPLDLELDELSAEDRQLAELGYVQVYKREFSWLSCISFAISISGLFASVATTFVYPLEAGGLSSAVWCWFISGAGCMCIALSVSELVSAYPTSGGLYFTCKYLVPDRWVAPVAWLAGWLNLIGQVAGLASTEYGCAQLLLAAVSMNKNFTYIPTDRQTVGVMAAVTLFDGALNSLSTAWLEKITRGYVLFHIGVLVSCCIALLVMCDDKHSTTDVWTSVVPDSGWKPAGWSWLFGFLSVSWTMTDYDATAHIAEEIKQPEIKAAWSISLALGFTYIGGWLFTIVLAYCAGDVESIINSPIKQPVAQIFYNVMGKSGGVAFTVFAFWAVSRDEMLPLSRVWYKINRVTGTSLNAVWLTTFCSIAINLIGLGSYTAISAIFTMTAIALDWSYCIPILMKLIFRRMTPGPFHLGVFSPFVNAWAVIWTAFVSIIFIMPTERPVTKENMNYCIVILAGVAFFSVGYWYVGGRYYYIGPRVKAKVAVDPDQAGKPSEPAGNGKPGELAAAQEPSTESNNS